MALIEVNNLKVYFPIRKGIFGKVNKYIRAVDDVSFKIEEGKTLGLVGESGAGKTTVGRSVLRAVEPTSGSVEYSVNNEVVDINRLGNEELRNFRQNVQLIFQDPYASLNPRMTVRDIIAEPLVARNLMKGKELDQRVREIAGKCKLNAEYLRRFPHAFSGGQRQRIGIARALISNPKFVVCDEALSALDVSTQAEIMNLLKDLQEELNLTYLFIAHDLSVVANISDYVGVMYVGSIMEYASTETIFSNPMHPYTEALFSAIPDVNPDMELKPVSLQGEIPNPADPPSGCRFHTRCRYARECCSKDVPEWKEIEPGHFVACHFAGKLDLNGAA